MTVSEGPTRSKKDAPPSLALLVIAGCFVVSALGYAAVIWSGRIRGYDPSVLVAVRNLLLFIPFLAVFVWLVRRKRLRHDTLLIAASILLFTLGSLAQYRLFSDPEYGSRGRARGAAREAKAQTVRLLNIQTGYDEQKKRFLFGDPAAVPQGTSTASSADRVTLAEILTSQNTYIPVLSFLAMAAAFLILRSDRFLLLAQRHALLIGVATLVPFALAVLLLSEEGKFLGQTTPWEPVKIFFLLSFTGMLADTYRHLRRTRWGLPTARYFVPFIVAAAMPVVPFFSLSDFGQMLVFFGVYLALYMVAVRRVAQLASALAIVAIIFSLFSVTLTAKTGAFVPGRVAFRFYQWQDTWTPPSRETWWWQKDFNRYLASINRNVDGSDQQVLDRLNVEAWNDRVLQQSQGLFGVHEGGVTGEGLGLGYPETVPISDSDFIYAAIAEETGLLGGLILLIAIGVVVTTGLRISVEAPDMFTKLIAVGVTAFLGLQSITNIGGVLRLLPMTGITLPFVSHGGWSLITSFAMVGILLAISHRNRSQSRAASSQA